MTLHYPDIFSGDAGINFATSYIVCAKATQGTTYKNPQYASFKAQAAAHNVYFTAYHFLTPGNAAAQAEFCHGVVGDTPLMLDVESSTAGNPTMSDVEEFISEYRTLGGKVHLLYLPHWYWQGNLGSPSLTGYKAWGVWLVSSDYTTYSDTGPGWDGYGGLEVAVWQYSSTVSYGGIAMVDFNAFKGSGTTDNATLLQEFENIVNTGNMADPMPTPAPASPTAYHVTELPPGWWEGQLTLTGTGTDGATYHTTTDDGKSWSTPRE